MNPRRGALGRAIERLLGRGPHEPESVSEEEIAGIALSSARARTGEGHTSLPGRAGDGSADLGRNRHPSEPAINLREAARSRDDREVVPRWSAQFAA